MLKTKWNWSEESERDGVGRRPAVLFSPAVQTRDMWPPRQAVQSGRARWTHYAQGQDRVAWRNTNGSFGNLEWSKLNLVSLCVHVWVCTWLCLCGTACVDNCPSPLSVCATPGCPHPRPPVDWYTHAVQAWLERSLKCCTGQLSDEVASHSLLLVGHLI